MEILRKLSSFNPPLEDMKTIYILYIRSILEQSSVIWHSSLTEENRADLERVQKNALRNILKEDYIDYNSALQRLNLETLEKRREQLLVRYGKQCLKLEQTKNLFPLNSTEHIMNTRQHKKYKETQCNTERIKKSTMFDEQMLVFLVFSLIVFSQLLLCFDLHCSAT